MLQISNILENCLKNFINCIRLFHKKDISYYLTNISKNRKKENDLLMLCVWEGSMEILLIIE